MADKYSEEDMENYMLGVINERDDKEIPVYDRVNEDQKPVKCGKRSACVSSAELKTINDILVKEFMEKFNTCENHAIRLIKLHYPDLADGAYSNIPRAAFPVDKYPSWVVNRLKAADVILTKEQEIRFMIHPSMRGRSILDMYMAQQPCNNPSCTRCARSINLDSPTANKKLLMERLVFDLAKIPVVKV